MRMTRSGEPVAMTVPYGSVVSAYSDAFGPAASGGLSVSSGSDLLDADARSQSLTVRSNEPDANHCCSRLQDVRRPDAGTWNNSPVGEAADVVGVRTNHGGFVERRGMAVGMRRPRFNGTVGGS